MKFEEIFVHYDVFNGDADGIIALLQLRLSTPKSSQLVTGVKRDIALLQQVVETDDVTSVTVLDVSLEKNIVSLNTLLQRQIPVFYCDHHRSGDVPDSPYLQSLINLDSETCTSLLINQKLAGQYQTWAIAAAFGDNMKKGALRLAQQLQLKAEQVDFLAELGTLINYNGYGVSLSDLHFSPAQLFQHLLAYPDPFTLQSEPDSVFYQLRQAYQQDIAQLSSLTSYYHDQHCLVYLLPCAAWARRISGVFGNQLANQYPDKACAVVTLNPSQHDYLVSVRAPLNNRIGADEICGQFASGGGRRAAAGINELPLAELECFIDALIGFYKE